MTHNTTLFRMLLLLLLTIPGYVAEATADTRQREDRTADAAPVKKVLFIGDSMTGWLADRMGAYGDQNGFEVDAVVWDGSTIKKWAAAPQRVKSIVANSDPDVVFICLGMNELFEANPGQRLGQQVDNLLTAVGKRDIVWIGPPSWPGYAKGETLNKWLEMKLGKDHFFRSFDLKLPRQSSKNPHPTKAGVASWMDTIAQWIPGHTQLNFATLDAPAAGKMSRGKNFLYRKMKQNL